MTTEQNNLSQENVLPQEQAVFQTPEEAHLYLQNEALERARIAEHKVAIILQEHRVRLEPHITITPHRQYAEIHFIPE